MVIITLETILNEKVSCHFSRWYFACTKRSIWEI